MIYLSPQSANIPKHYGQILTPASKVKRPAADRFAIDNGVFTKKFDADKFMKYLEHLKPYQDRCLFVSAPDVIGDYVATLARYEEWYPRLRAEGWPVAYVAQDGSELAPLPECQAVFIGGTTEWKMGEGALEMIRRGRERGIWTHVGRVNSQKRMRHFQLASVDSVDGTTITFSPDRAMRLIDAQLANDPLLKD